MRIFKISDFTINKLLINFELIQSQWIWSNDIKDALPARSSTEWYKLHAMIYVQSCNKNISKHGKYHQHLQHKVCQSLVIKKNVWLRSEWGHHTPYCKVLIIKVMGFRLLHIQNKYSNYAPMQTLNKDSYIEYNNNIIRNVSYKYQNISMNSKVEEIYDENLLDMFASIVEKLQDESYVDFSKRDNIDIGHGINREVIDIVEDSFAEDIDNIDAFVGDNRTLKAVSFKKKLKILSSDLYDEEEDEYIDRITNLRYKKNDFIIDEIDVNPEVVATDLESYDRIRLDDDHHLEVSVVPELNESVDYCLWYTKYLIIRAGHSVDQILPIDQNIHLKVSKKERKLIIFGWNKSIINNFVNRIFNYRRPSAYTGNGIRRKHYTVIRKGGKEKDRKNF